jgi:hypothetical protein
MPDDSDLRPELTADCSRCFGLCCVAPGFSASADFAISKPAGTPCQNLQSDFRCGIHSHLRSSGFAGCTVYDCHGAGQRIARVTFGGRDWRSHPDLARPMFAAFAVMRELHELMWYLDQARALGPAQPVRAELDEAVERLSILSERSADDLIALDLVPSRESAGALLRRVGALVRAGVLGAFLADPTAPAGEDDLARSTGMPPGQLRPVLLRLERAQWIMPGETRPDGRSGYVLTPRGLAGARDEVIARDSAP